MRSLFKTDPRAACFIAIASLLMFSPASRAQTNFATLTTDGAWTWYNDPRALFHDGKLYYGYVRAGNSKTALSVFNLSTGYSSNLFDSGFTQLDDHNNPGLLSKSDGKLLAIYARHISDQYFSYRTSASTTPTNPAGWNAEINIPNSGAGMTYANPFQLSAESGKIYNFCRNQNFNPTIFTSTNGGTNWSAPQHFISAGSGGTVRPYVKYASDYTSRVDFLYTDGHPRDIANSLYHLYYTGGAFYKTDGTFVKNYASLPILHDSGERGSVIYQFNNAAQTDPNEWIPTGRAWNWETAYQSNGAPVSVFTVQRDSIAPSGSLTDRIYYYYARWTGTNWQKRFIAHAGRPLYNAEDDYAGGICIDPVEPHVIYISSNAQDPFNLTDTTNVTLRASERYELWRGVTADGGLTFSWTQITTNSASDNLRPYIPRRNGGERCVIWFRGNYSTYTSYSCSIVGLFTTAIPTPPPPPATPQLIYLDATSGIGGNTTLANGSLFSHPTNGTTGADNNWELRTVLASHGTIYESGGENVTENAPEIRTTISGLVPGATYTVFVNFWDPVSAVEDWSIRAGFTANPGANTLFSAADATAELGVATAAVLASSQTFSTAPTIFLESARNLHAGHLGTTAANGSGQIHVFLDDLPTSLNVNRRTWYDGVSYGLVTASYATNMAFNQSGNQLSLSWPATHVGWRLETQINPNTTGLGTNWSNVTGANLTNLVSLPINTSNSSIFYRLAYP